MCLDVIMLRLLNPKKVCLNKLKNIKLSRLIFTFIFKSLDLCTDKSYTSETCCIAASKHQLYSVYASLDPAL